MYSTSDQSVLFSDTRAQGEERFLDNLGQRGE